MVKKTLIVLAMTGIYMWIRRKQRQILGPTAEPLPTAQAEWTNQGEADPSATRDGLDPVVAA